MTINELTGLSEAALENMKDEEIAHILEPYKDRVRTPGQGYVPPGTKVDKLANSAQTLSSMQDMLAEMRKALQ